jgi:hypothetical protein
MKQYYFNFRHAMARAGIPMHTRLNWAMGRALQMWAKVHGVEPVRLLTEKTAASPSVAAPHCIAHYPIALLPDAAEHLKSVWRESPDNSEGLQGQLAFCEEGES